MERISENSEKYKRIPENPKECESIEPGKILKNPREADEHLHNLMRSEKIPKKQKSWEGPKESEWIRENMMNKTKGIGDNSTESGWI